MNTSEAELTTYLTREAERVVVYDSLDDIEGDVAHLVFTRPVERARRLAPLAALVAVALSVVAAMLVVDARESTTANAPAAAAPAEDPATAPLDESQPSDERPPADVPVVAPGPVSVPLPAGGTVQGFTPTCSTVDSIEFTCEIPDYPARGVVDRTGEIQVIVDDTGHLSGGCRSANPNGTVWTCFVGQRSVDEGVVHPPTLGQEWTAGWSEG